MNDSKNMSLNQTDENALLAELNDRELALLLPTIITLFIFGILGIPGNIFTIYFYRKGALRSNFRLFVVTVACLDLLSCCAAIPLESSLLMSGYAQDNRHELLCKLSRFFGIYMGYAAGFILTLIAIERYRKLCRPFKKQLLPNLAIKLCVGAVIFGLFLLWPSALVFGMKTFKTEVNGQALTVLDCSISDDATKSVLKFAYLVLLLLLAMFCIVLTVVLYALIRCHLERESTRRRSIRKSEVCVDSRRQSLSSPNIVGYHTDKNKTTDNDEEPTVEEELEGTTSESMTDKFKEKEVCKVPTTKQKQTEIFLGNDTKTWVKNTLNPEKTPEQVKPLMKHSNKRASRKILNQARANQTSRVMFIISAIYVGSYVPNLTILTIGCFVDGFFYKTFTERAVSNFFVRLVFLNCAVNPIVYLLCDSNLRSDVAEFLGSLKKRLC